MYIVYIHSEYYKITTLYSKTVEEHKKLENNLLEFNGRMDKLYKEITNLKVEKTKLEDENKQLKSRINNLRNITNKLREKLKEMQKAVY